MDVYEVLANLNINYREYSHEAIFTVEESKDVDELIPGFHCKNLFLKNKQTKDYYLIIVGQDKKINLKELGLKLGIKRITFGLEDELMNCLRLTSGSVGPFGLINDINNVTKVVIDSEIQNVKSVNFHPNINTKTLNITPSDLNKFLEWSGNNYIYLEI